MSLAITAPQLRTFFLLHITTIAVLLLAPAPGRAAVESCGAHLRPLVAVKSSDANAATFAFVVRADTARSAQGSIVADTSTGWYSWLFPMTALTPHVDTINAGSGVSLRGNDFESAPLFVSFPAGTTIKHAWVTSAKTSGEKFFGFDARGDASCSVPDFNPGDEARAAPNGLASAVPTHVIAAMPTDAPEKTDCAHEFVETQMHDVPPPTVSVYSGRMQTIAAVALDAKGSVLDDWMVAPSGNVAWDRDVLTRLRLTKYDAPISYCRPVSATLYFVFASGR